MTSRFRPVTFSLLGTVGESWFFRYLAETMLLRSWRLVFSGMGELQCLIPVSACSVKRNLKSAQLPCDGHLRTVELMVKTHSPTWGFLYFPPHLPVEDLWRRTLTSCTLLFSSLVPLKELPSVDFVQPGGNTRKGFLNLKNQQWLVEFSVLCQGRRTAFFLSSGL